MTWGPLHLSRPCVTGVTGQIQGHQTSRDTTVDAEGPVSLPKHMYRELAGSGVGPGVAMIGEEAGDHLAPGGRRGGTEALGRHASLTQVEGCS